VILLHGFPEFWWGWRHQIPALAAIGRRVIALDMRGYNQSGKPKGVEPYQIQHLTGDVKALIEHLGYERAAVVGHDWGGGVAWAFALMHPERLERLAILNLPHPARMAAGMRTLRQLRKSWYIFFFQIPGLPEWSSQRNHFAILKRAFTAPPAQAGVFTAADLDAYERAWAQPGALTAMFNYYRAFLKGARRSMGLLGRRIEHPVLVLWGERDPYLGKELATPPVDLVPSSRVRFFPEASHWVQHEQAAAINAELVAFLRT
jgi:pimeloyl-ACP methyl ester carboxylesterase